MKSLMQTKLHRVHWSRSYRWRQDVLPPDVQINCIHKNRYADKAGGSIGIQYFGMISFSFSDLTFKTLALPLDTLNIAHTTYMQVAIQVYLMLHEGI